MNIDKQIAQAVEIGERNKEIIDLAESWCRHIRQERGMMGVGMVEIQTGLPVSGGTFKCEFAARGALFQGMNLEPIAYGFYQNNCKGCKHREATGVLYHLGLWAEERIEAEHVAEEQRLLQQQHDQDRRSQRSENRRLALGTLDAERQSLLDLIDIVDSSAGNHESSESLFQLATLHPEAFTHELIEVLVNDAVECRNDILLQTVFIVQAHTGTLDTDRMIDLALWGLTQRVALSASAGFLTNRAKACDVSGNHEAVTNAIELAGPRSYEFFIGDIPPEPDVFIRFVQVDTESTLSILNAELLHGDPWRRACASKAATYALETVPERAEEILAMLLDSLKYEDVYEYSGDPNATQAACTTTAKQLLMTPELVVSLIEDRWSGASQGYKKRLLRPYDVAIRDNLNRSLDGKTTLAVSSKCIAVILKEADVRLMIEASELLELVCRYQSETATMEQLFGALSVVSERIDSCPSTAEENEDPFKQVQDRFGLRNCASRIVESLTCQKKNHDGFWAYVTEMWDGAPDESEFKDYVFVVVAEACSLERDLPYALPILYTAMFGPSSFKRSKAIDSLGGIARKFDALPDEVAEGICAALSDQILSVAISAARVVRLFPVTNGRKPVVCKSLVNIALNCAYEGMARECLDVLSSLLSISADSVICQSAKEIALNVIDMLPSYYASRALVQFRCLSTAASWMPSVIKALSPSKDPNDDLARDNRDKLVIRLAEEPSLVLSYAEELVQLGCVLAAVNRVRAWQVADLLSEAGATNDAVSIASFVASSLPDTPESRLSRLYALQICDCYKFELAVSSNDSLARETAASSWKANYDAEVKFSMEVGDAEGQFFPFAP
jgi:hypothetical protein